MTTPLGLIAEISRYPVKSMAGVALESAFLGWYGLAGDRRFAFRRVGDRSGMPWLTASRLSELVLYRPCGLDERAGEPLPTHVCTPSGAQPELWSEDLRREIAGRLGGDTELMQARHGVFDEAAISVIATATTAAVAREAGVAADSRRFRPNIVIACEGGEPFLEDGWIGGTLVFGEGDEGPAVRVTMRDERCRMLTLDPDTAHAEPRVLKAAVRLNRNYAGVYATVVQTGTLCVGDPVRLAPGSR